MSKPPTIVVTGAGGFIGGHLVADFRRQGIRNIRTIDIKPLDDWYQMFPDVENHAGPVDGDARDFRLYRRFCKGATDVYQLAADMGGMGFIENNKALCMLSVLTNTHMLLASQEAGSDRFFFCSSACVYNAKKQLDPNVTALAEADAYPGLPEDGYGWEKLFSERMCRHFREDFGIQTRVARFHNVYGPNGTWCACMRDIQKIMHSDILEPINLESSELVTINKLVDIAEDIAGIHLERRSKLDAPRGVAGRNSDNTRIRGYMGWEPSTRLRDGIAATYRWIEGEFRKDFTAESAKQLATSGFSHGSKPIPGDGYVKESRHMATWKQGISAGYGGA
jgi:GDP-D-mannose 3', 5'-epimerase